MENASKALIIAGAILLAILIISLGILIYNQASSVVQDNAMSTVEIQQFNQQFTQYEGSSVRGSTVRALYQAVLSNNVSQDSNTRKVDIEEDTTGGKDPIEGDGNLGETATKMPGGFNNIETGTSYSVDPVAAWSTGSLIAFITIIPTLINNIDINIAPAIIKAFDAFSIIISSFEFLIYFIFRIFYSKMLITIFILGGHEPLSLRG